MTPVFSDQEYRRLMMLAYLGEWMINAVCKDPDPAYEDTVSKVLAFAEGTPLQDLILFDDNGGNWVPTEAFETEAHVMIDQYDDKTFWEELTARLTERDLVDRHGERAVHAMRPDQRTRTASSIAKAYTKEFEEHGLERIGVADE